MSNITSEGFLKDVSKHQMTVRRDDGIYRHLVFRSVGEDNWNQWFEIITWPGTLVLGGDMGTWAFRRVDDMFTFFRRNELSINEGYWSEKLEAVDRVTGNAKKFSPECFRRSIFGSLDGYGLDPGERKRVEAALDEEIFRHNDDEHGLRAALNDFEHDGFSLSEIWEISGREWTGRFIWCLYAIVWGIQQYDALKKSDEMPAESVAR